MCAVANASTLTTFRLSSVPRFQLEHVGSGPISMLHTLAALLVLSQQFRENADRAREVGPGSTSRSNMTWYSSKLHTENVLDFTHGSV